MKIKILILAILFFSCIRNTYAQYCTNDSRYTEVPYFDSIEISVGANIQYGTAIDYLGNNYALRMDVYYPNLNIDSSLKRPLIILFHGGGFVSGDKQSGDIKDLCIHLARRGFVCATLNYRLGYDFTEYGQFKARYRAIQDGHAALRYIVNSANNIRVDTNWIFVGGQSAGSLLALGMVYADQLELDSISLLYNNTSVGSELGSIYTSGNNLTNTYSIKGIFNNWGGVTATEIDLDEMIPTISFHGELDTTVLINADSSFIHYTLNGSRAIHNQLILNNICSELTVDMLGEHGIFRNSSSEFRASRASCFFKSIFCNSCTSFSTTDSIASNCSLPVSVNENYFENGVNIYPNPFDNKFIIEGIRSSSELTIYNSYGNLVYKEMNNSGIVEAELIPGIYLLQIRNLTTNKIFKTIIKRN